MHTSIMHRGWRPQGTVWSLCQTDVHHTYSKVEGIKHKNSNEGNGVSSSLSFCESVFGNRERFTITRLEVQKGLNVTRWSRFTRYGHFDENRPYLWKQLVFKNTPILNLKPSHMGISTISVQNFKIRPISKIRPILMKMALYQLSFEIEPFF